jgi:serine/threonine protein kinase/tetratricopeptide (TPR) repeat protein
MVGTVPGYEILDELGRGGMGVVYKARQQSLNRLVALKMILTADDKNSPVVARFLAEAEAVAAVRHPNIVQVHDYGETEGRPFMALEFLPGGTLADRLKDGKRLPAREAASLVEKIARGLQAAHAKGIIHRDIKPGNILFDEAGEPKVADFGLAKRADSDLTRTGAIMGTPAYMAPEQADGHTREVGPTADVWSIGVILYEALTGTRPFTAKRTDELLVKVLMSDPDPLRSRSGDVPRDLETVCMKCLEKNPARRYPSALALAQELERFLAGEPILARPEGPLGRTWRKVRRRGLVVGLTIALLLATGIAASLVMRSSSERQVKDLSRQLDEQLEAADWPQSHRESLDSLADRLVELDPTQNDAVKAKFVDRVSRRVRSLLGRSRVLPADVQVAEDDVRWLAMRDAATAAKLEQEIKDRLRAWQVAAELAPPFAEAASVFPTEAVRVTPEGLVPQEPHRGRNGVITRLGSVGQVRFEVEFGPGWQTAREIGVGIDTLPGAAGYQFEFVAVSRPLPAELSETGSGVRTSNPTFRDTNGHGEVRIVREGVTLRQRNVVVEGDTLRIFAEREGDRLMAQVNDSEPIVFLDVAPIVGRDGASFAVVWPEAVPLRRLRASLRPVPREASPLEKADDLFARGDFAAALPLYRHEARTGDPAIRAEARCKEALCLAGLNQLDAAAVEFEAVASAPGDRWPVTATVQLGLLRLRQKRFDEADPLFAAASVRCTPEQIARYIPAAVRHEILSQPGLPGSVYVMPTIAALRRTESLYKLHELLGEPGQLSSRLYDLGRAHALVGEHEKAEREFWELIREATPDPTRALQTNWLLPWVVRWFTWVKARREGPEQAITALMPTLRLMGLDQPSTEPIPPSVVGVMISIARLYAIADRRDVAD